MSRMERAVRAFDLLGPLRDWRLAWRLRERGPCLMCELGYGPHSRALGARPEILERGRDLGGMRGFARATEAWWRPTVCGPCAGDRAPARCREHLREDLLRGEAGDLETHRRLVESIAQHVTRFSRSFRWELRGTDTVADRAALISAVGWCGGWQPWLRLMGQKS